MFFFSPLLRRWYLSDPAQQPFRPPVRTVDLDSWNFPPAGTSKKSARREGKKKGTFPACGGDAGPAGLGSSTCAPAFPFSMSSSQITTLPRASRPGLVASEAGVVGPGRLLLVSNYVRSQRPLGQLPGTADVLVSCNVLRAFCVIHHSLVIGCYRWYSVLGPCGKKIARSHATAACGRPESGRTVVTCARRAELGREAKQLWWWEKVVGGCG